jgi:hypothetical protein
MIQDPRFIQNTDISLQHVKVKVKLSLCLTKYHAMKRHGEMEVQLHAFLTLAPDEGEWPASRPCRFLPGIKAPWYPFVKKLGGPQSRSGCGGKKRIIYITGPARN